MYWVGSESRVFIEDRSIGGNRSFERSHRRPSGVLHAVDSETEEVACGRPLDGLHRFPGLAWSAFGAVNKCTACLTAVAGP